MTSIIYNITLKEPPFDKREALRYAGVRGEDAMSEALVDECAAELLPRLSYRVCYRELSLDEPWICDIVCSSESLRRHLLLCSRALVLAATVGPAPDTLVRRAAVSSPAKAVVCQAIGAERIEALCDEFCLEMSARYAKEGLSLTPRFSPGYGDLSLSFQKDIFALLDCQRQIGLTLGESLLMMPTKSVTAFVGLQKS